MKNVTAALGLFSIVVCALGCSGSHSSNAGAGGQSFGGAGNAGSGNTNAGSAGSSSGTCSANADCSVGVCSAGMCKEVSCVPNATFCADGGVWSCGADGTPTTLTQHCTADQYCLEKSNTATCSATACFPGDAMCVGTVATHCEPDGSGPKPGGDDCVTLKQACYSGQCQDLLCTPGQKLCDNNSVYLCGDAGTSRVLVSTCSALEVCDEASGACQTKICDPGQLGCDTNRVVTCNVSGSGWVQSGPDCAASKGVCISGTCQPTACTAGLGFCQNGNAYACSADGTTATLAMTCTGGTRCVLSGAYAYCDSPVCQAGSVTCDGTVVSTCNADGSDWLPGGTDCTVTNTICSNGKCIPPVCTPSALFCANGNVQQCDDQGSTYNQSQFCASGTYCLTRAQTSSCEPTPCTPDTAACAAEKLGTCATDGMTVVAAGATDCGALKEVCTLQGCAKTAVDTISTTNQLSGANANEVLANVIAVQSARKLTMIEAYLSMPSARSLSWVVYVQTNADNSGEFDLAYQKTTTGTGAGFQSSGAISIELQAGKAYAIGVAASDGSFVYYYDTPTAVSSLNFAHVIGSEDTDSSSSFDFYPTQPPGSVYAQRLTTTTP
jgi:hypothetical protein